MAEAASDLRRALYEQYRAVPAHLCAEIIHGTLYVLPRPSPPHANAASVLGGELSGPFQRGDGGPGGWWILHEPELHLVALEPMHRSRLSSSISPPCGARRNALQWSSASRRAAPANPRRAWSAIEAGRLRRPFM